VKMRLEGLINVDNNWRFWPNHSVIMSIQFAPANHKWDGHTIAETVALRRTYYYVVMYMVCSPF